MWGRGAAPLGTYAFPPVPSRASFVPVRGAFLILLAAGCGVWPAAAQKRASLGIGVGTVRYPGGTSFSSAAFSPTIGFSSPPLDADGSASFASLPNGVWSSQGRGDVWVTSPPLYRGWRFGAEGIVAGTARGGGGRTAAGPGGGGAPWLAARWGVGGRGGPLRRGGGGAPPGPGGAAP